MFFAVERLAAAAVDDDADDADADAIVDAKLEMAIPASLLFIPFASMATRRSGRGACYWRIGDSR